MGAKSAISTLPRSLQPHHSLEPDAWAYKHAVETIQPPGEGSMCAPGSVVVVVEIAVCCELWLFFS